MPKPLESPCPPTPPAVAEVARHVAETYGVATQVARARDLATDDHVAYRRLIAAYIDRLTEVAQEEDRLRG